LTKRGDDKLPTPVKKKRGVILNVRGEPKRLKNMKDLLLNDQPLKPNNGLSS